MHRSQHVKRENIQIRGGSTAENIIAKELAIDVKVLALVRIAFERNDRCPCHRRRLIARNAVHVILIHVLRVRKREVVHAEVYARSRKVAPLVDNGKRPRSIRAVILAVGFLVVKPEVANRVQTAAVHRGGYVCPGAVEPEEVAVSVHIRPVGRHRNAVQRGCDVLLYEMPRRRPVQNGLLDTCARRDVQRGGARLRVLAVGAVLALALRVANHHVVSRPVKREAVVLATWRVFQQRAGGRGVGLAASCEIAASVERSFANLLGAERRAVRHVDVRGGGGETQKAQEGGQARRGAAHDGGLGPPALQRGGEAAGGGRKSYLRTPGRKSPARKAYVPPFRCLLPQAHWPRSCFRSSGGGLEKISQTPKTLALRAKKPK
ncbi:hypothetical protein FGB62_70g00 [Gracilaria domingensis]|nr:hypothetical protein FGB62_70g00 [Gracilaria domingensis]